MASRKSGANGNWLAARRHLARVDPAMKEIIRKVGPCTLAPRRDYFVKLCHSIFAQQLSTKVAKVLFTRFCGQFERCRPTPLAVLEFLQKDEETIRVTGLSRQKRGYIHDLATHFSNGKVQTRKLATMDDEAIIQAMLPIKGIGRWTVEMFLIFCLNRPDVFPLDDLGVRKMAGVVNGMKEMPTKKELLEIGEKWKPWRTVASWYLWKYAEVKEK
jgi:DNA-3-methyladenine glycosylase II